MRILVTGREGQVASALAEEGTGHEIIRLGRPQFDLAAPQGIRDALEKHHPDVVVSAAAYTAVDLAESELDLAMAVNGTAPGMIAAAAAEFGLPIIHLSTDYVFDGTKPTPYREADPTGPESAYGRTKLAGEIAVATANPRHFILRTAWVYAHGGKN
ncbi:MAG: sugar nucleotide-binding protein, partial [Methylobacterium sp.]|nr:sugar nucleotide-binding protein [Methylobacterium sp.]